MYNDKRYRYAKTRNMVMTDEGETPDPAAPAVPEPEKSDGESCEAGLLQKVRDFCSRFTEPDKRKDCEDTKAKEMCNKDSSNPCEEEPAFLINPFLNFLRQVRKCLNMNIMTSHGHFY